MKTRGRRKHRKHGPSLSALAYLPAMLREADVLLIVPPFHKLKSPGFAVHLLQACGLEAGFRVQVLYANLLLAAVIGEEDYGNICDAPWGSFLGERFFARCAFGLPPLGRRAGRMLATDWVIGPDKDWEISPDFECDACRKPITLSDLRRLERYTDGYIDRIAQAVSGRRYRIVGCSTCFEQTAASVALLNRIKTLSPQTVTILGGANCEGEMAQGLASLPSDVDYIFSGESEVTFVKFVRTVLAGSRPEGRPIHGEPCRDLDALPTPVYEEFYTQRQKFLPMTKVGAGHTEIPYETSRGCWWGQKHHCSFCGLNEESIAFRQKSSDRVIEELHALVDGHPSKKIVMVDNIMPYSYFKTLLPHLASELRGVTIFYEQKANLSLPRLLALKRAGITSIQPGIESLSSRLLTLMKKGLQARQNLTLLRNARAAGIDLHWNLLWGFPGDDVKVYEDTLAILPLLYHLQPPRALVHLSVERFSPYFSDPSEFGIRNIKPLAGYRDFLPQGADVKRMAYHFTAQYQSGAHDHVEVIHKMWQALRRWRAAWVRKGGSPNEDLRLLRSRRAYRVVDSRTVRGKEKSYSLDESEASALVTTRPYSGSGLEAWALREELAVIADGWFVPLPVCDPKILLELSGEHNPDQPAQHRSLQVLDPNPVAG